MEPRGIVGDRERRANGQISNSPPALAPILSTRAFYILEFCRKIKRTVTHWCGRNFTFHSYPGSALA